MGCCMQTKNKQQKQSTLSHPQRPQRVENQLPEQVLQPPLPCVHQEDEPDFYESGSTRHQTGLKTFGSTRHTHPRGSFKHLSFEKSVDNQFCSSFRKSWLADPSSFGSRSTEELAKYIQQFSWETRAEQVPMLARASIEILGLEEPTPYLDELNQCLQQFLTAQAVQDEPASYSLPGPLECLWTIAISYDESYQHLSDVLFRNKCTRGRIDDIQPDCLSLHQYSSNEWKKDRLTTLWVTAPQAETVVLVCLQKMKQQYTLEDIAEECRKKLNIATEVTRMKIQGPRYHRFHRGLIATKQQVETEIHQALQQAQPQLIEALATQLPIPLGKSAFIDELLLEYQRFMTMLYFTKYKIVPGPLINFVWLLHVSDPDAYASFCDRVFHMAVAYIHTNVVLPELQHDLKESYIDTLDYYRFLFQTEPPAAFWPEPSARFGRQHARCMWLSVFRVCEYLSKRQDLSADGSLLHNFLEEYPKMVMDELMEASQSLTPLLQKVSPQKAGETESEYLSAQEDYPEILMYE